MLIIRREIEAIGTLTDGDVENVEPDPSHDEPDLTDQMTSRDFSQGDAENNKINEKLNSAPPLF